MLRAVALASLALSARAGLFQEHHLFSVHAATNEIGHYLASSGIELWNQPLRDQPSTVEMRVPPEDVAKVKRELAHRNITFSVVTTDVEAEFAKQVEGRKPYKKGNVMDFDYFQYHPYEEIIDWIHDMHAQFPHLTELVHIGWSYEDRELLAIKITGNSTTANKKKIFTNYGIHAREWMSPAAGLFMAGQFLMQYDTDANVRNLVDHIEWTFLLSTNPDGYHTTWTINRLWRKTRSVNPGYDCLGTDPNRNWDFEWGRDDGSSDQPCSADYRGAAPFSEPETRAVAEHLQKDTYHGYMDWHCCGAMWMSSWGYTRELPPEPDYTQQMAQNYLVRDAMQAIPPHHRQYAVGPASIVIYPTSGSTDDYAYGALGILYSICIELPGTFVSPASQIEGVVRETWAGIKTFGHVILSHNKQN